MKFLNSVNLTGNELQNARIQNLASAPTGTEGLVYFDTTKKQIGIYQNGSWRYTVTSDSLHDGTIAVNTKIPYLDANSLVVENPASASITSGTSKIPITASNSSKIDVSYIPTLDNTPKAVASVDLNTQRIINLSDPTNPQDAATKNYVDTAVQGLDPKASVRAASNGSNITLSGTQTVDGVALSIGDRVLVKDQTTQSQNGIYVVASGAWGRAADADSWNELVNAYVFVESSTGTQADTGWVCTVDPGGTLGTTAITLVQFSAAGQTSAGNVGTGTGLIFRSKDGTTLNFKTLKAGSSRLGITNNADDVTVDVVESALVFANMTSSGTLSVLKGGTGTTTSTGTGGTNVVLSGSPTIDAPTLTNNTTVGTINKITFTAPASSATLTLANGSTLATIGAYSTTFTSTGATNLTLPATTDTLVGKATADIFTNKTYDTAGTGNVFKVNGRQITDYSGSNGIVALTVSPTITTPTLSGNTTAGTINNVTISTPASAATLTLANNSSFITVGAFSTTLRSSAATDVTLPTTGTLATVSNAETITNKTFTTGNTWQGNIVAVQYGGTGASTVLGAKANLGFMQRYAAAVPSGSLTAAITHGLNTNDVIVSVYEVSSNEQVYPSVVLTADTNIVNLVFTVAPTSNQYRVVVIG